MLTTTLKHMFPDSDLLTDIQITQTDSGSSQITQWNRPEPQPTQAEIEAAYPAALAAAQRAAIPSVTRKQMLIALHRVGLLDPIKAAVAASGNIELQIAFDEALNFERSDAFLASMQAAMGKTDAEVDAIFALAASI